MIKQYPLTDTHRRFIPKLKGWLDGYTTDSVWVRGGRIRDKVFFTDLIRKVQLLGEYDDIDRENLQWITEEMKGGGGDGSTINKP